jgi:hypothetical protein
MKPKLARQHEPAYFLRLSEDSPEDGPLVINDLRAMAAAGEITPETLFRREEEAEWRPIADDAPLAVDLWQEETSFDPATTFHGEAAAAGDESPDQQGGTLTTAELLQQNLERDRLARQAAGEEEASSWKGTLFILGPVARWGGALLLAALVLFIWIGPVTVAASTALVTTMFAAAAIIALVGFDLAQLAASPFSGAISALFEGTGGGAKADYWTADSLLQQGELRLALAEYRKIVMRHPREIEAYVKGIRAARSLGSQADADRLYALAMKNLKSDQDRNLFINAIEKMQ